MSSRLRVLVFLLLPGIAACVGSPSVPFTQERADLSQPVLRFVELRVGGPGTIESLAGSVESWTRHGWRPLHVGSTLEHGARVQVAASASLTVRFGARERVEFAPAPEVRRFELSVQPAAHGT